MNRTLNVAFAACILLCGCLQKKERQHWVVTTDSTKLIVELIADSIECPFGLEFVSPSELLVTNRPGGEIFLVNIESGNKVRLEGLPEVYKPGGMLDVKKHPDFENNHWLYFSYCIGDDSASTMVIDRAKLDGNSLTGNQRIFTALPFHKEANHYGNRIVFDDGFLFATMGDHYFLRDSAQSLNNHLGKVIRLHDNGRIPADNPFANVEHAKPEVWSYGHRNPQGLIVHPETGQLWEHEHGPKGGDEINIIKPGANYGWPIICHGIDYDGKPIGAGITEQEGLEQPIYYYTPSIAPCGMDIYTGDLFPSWKGNLFIGALALQHLNRVVIEKGKVIKEERLLGDLKLRFRSVKVGPDGFIYVGVDGGKVLRIVPGQ